jgi:hypothetical protein
MKKYVWLFACFVFVGSLHGQEEIVGMPLKVNVGVGIGPSSPTGAWGDRDDAGWNAGAKIRLEGWIPLQLVGMVQYNRLPNRSPVAVGNSPLSNSHSGESDVAWLYGVGVEYPVSIPILRPYFGVDGFVTSFSNTAANSGSISREGIDFGVGTQIPLVVFGIVDVSLKYQIFNIAGKEQNEDIYSQIMANISLSFDIL